MLNESNAIATLAVKDLAAAERFYEGKLGLKVHARQGDEVVSYRTGSSLMNVYRSEFAGSNRATAVSWVVDDIDDMVRDLKAKGIAFEHYDMPGVTHEGDLHVADGMRVAWFKDPDGNIHNLIDQ